LSPCSAKARGSCISPLEQSMATPQTHHTEGLRLGHESEDHAHMEFLWQPAMSAQLYIVPALRGPAITPCRRRDLRRSPQSRSDATRWRGPAHRGGFNRLRVREHGASIPFP
jgi:hypothetical protein